MTVRVRPSRHAREHAWRRISYPVLLEPSCGYQLLTTRLICFRPTAPQYAYRVAQNVVQNIAYQEVAAEGEAVIVAWSPSPLTDVQTEFDVEVDVLLQPEMLNENWNIIVELWLDNTVMGFALTNLATVSNGRSVFRVTTLQPLLVSANYYMQVFVQGSGAPPDWTLRTVGSRINGVEVHCWHL